MLCPSKQPSTPWEGERRTEQVDCYYVRDTEHDRSWGFFFVHHNGMLVAHTDYGTYGYWWGAPGRPFKEFLARLTDTDYLLDKISHDDWLDERQTRKEFEENLLQMRRRRCFDRERGRELWDAMADIEDQRLAEWGMKEPELAIEECYEWARYDYPPAAKAFAERLFPLLRADLTQELEAAQTPIQSSHPPGVGDDLSAPAAPGGIQDGRERGA